MQALPFELVGTVTPGKQLGTQLGFPTANIAYQPESRSWPREGVYAGIAHVEGEDLSYVCILNQGRHPTVPEGAPTIEAHVLDFSGDLYGKRVSVEYLHFIRPEKKFASLDELKAQIARDGETAREYFRSTEAKK